MDYVEASRVIDDQTHPDWLAAYQFLQWHDIWYGSGAPRAELVDWDEPDPRVPDDDEDDFTLDDVSIGPAYGCDGDRYYVEANSGPGWTAQR